MEDNKTTIDMEFVDEETKDEAEVTDLQKVEESKSRGPIGKAVDWITTPFRFLYNKAKKSPMVAGLGGAVIGAAGGVGGKMLYDHFKGKRNGSFIPADPIEVPDEGESYVDSATSYESTED